MHPLRHTDKFGDFANISRLTRRPAHSLTRLSSGCPKRRIHSCVCAKQTWARDNAAMSLAPVRVTIIEVDLDAYPRDEAILSDAERARAAAFRFDSLRKRYVAAHCALRHTLAGHVGAQARDLMFATSAHGRPSLVNRPTGLDFNLAHSAGFALIAIAHEARIGVDIEPVRPIDDRMTLAARFFAPGETTALRAVPSHEADAAFLRCWTRKEAYIKGLGLGLSHSLNAFEVSLDADARLLNDKTDPSASARWSLHDLSRPPRYIAALAADRPIVVFREER